MFIALNPMTAITLGVVLLHEPVTTQYLVTIRVGDWGIILANRAAAVHRVSA